MNYFDKNGLGYILDYFSQTHLVTLPRTPRRIPAIKRRAIEGSQRKRYFRLKRSSEGDKDPLEVAPQDQIPLQVRATVSLNRVAGRACEKIAQNVAQYYFFKPTYIHSFFL
jgi:hypothetical protein